MRKNLLAPMALIITMGLVGSARDMLSTAASASTTNMPSCSTVSVAKLKVVLGGSPSAASASTSTSGGATTLTCNYGSNDSITYMSGQNAKTFQASFFLLRKSAGATKLDGLGGGAYRVPASNTISRCTGTGKCTTTTEVELRVVVLDRTMIFTIQAPKVTAAQEESLAREMLSLIRLQRH